MSKLLLLGGAVIVACVVGYVFAKWERTGREHWAVFFILAVVVIDSVLYNNGTDEGKGLFHPGAGTLNFRLPEVLITVALVVRLVTGGKPRRIGWPAMLWAAVAAWWALESFEGLLRHNDTVQLPYQAKAIVYVVGAYALASGVHVRRYLDGRGFERLLRWSAVGAVALLLFTFDHKRTFNIHAPLFPWRVSAGSAPTPPPCSWSVGAIGLMLELAMDHRSRLNMLCVIPLAVSPFFAYQRAVLILLAAVAAVIVGVGLGTKARERMRVRAFEVVMAFLAGIGLVLAVLLVPAITTGQSVTAPLSSTYQRTVGNSFGSRGKVESAQDRVNKWSVAFHDAEQHVFLGQGFGYTFPYFNAGPNLFVTTNVSDNTDLDLFLTTGLIGVLLFVLSMTVSLTNGFAAWRLHPDRMVAVLALALVAVLVGFIAKAQVESIFDNYRLATVFGLSLGMLRSAVTSGGGDLRALRTQQESLQYEAV